MNEIVETIHDKQNSPIQLQDLLKNVKESLDFSIGHDSLSLLFENAGFTEHCNQLVKNSVRIRVIVERSIQERNYSINCNRRW